MTKCYHCKEKEADPETNFCSEEHRIAYWKRAFKDADDFEAREQLGKKNRRKVAILHKRIINYQDKLTKIKDEYMALTDYFNEDNGLIWGSIRDRDSFIQNLKNKHGIIKRG